MVLTTPLLLTVDWLSAAVALGIELLLFALAGVTPRLLVARTWPILVSAPIAGLSMLLYGQPEGTEYWSFWLARITDGSIELAHRGDRARARDRTACCAALPPSRSHRARRRARAGRAGCRPGSCSGALAATRLVGLFVEDWRAMGLVPSRARHRRPRGDPPCRDAWRSRCSCSRSVAGASSRPRWRPAASGRTPRARGRASRGSARRMPRCSRSRAAVARSSVDRRRCGPARSTRCGRDIGRGAGGRARREPCRRRGVAPCSASMLGPVPAIAAVLAARGRARATIVLIDGPSGAGKSTFADRLFAAWPGPAARLVRLDQVYPGWHGLDPGAASAASRSRRLARARCARPLATVGLVGRGSRRDRADAAGSPAHRRGLRRLRGGCRRAHAAVRVWVTSPDDAAASSCPRSRRRRLRRLLGPLGGASGADTSRAAARIVAPTCACGCRASRAPDRSAPDDLGPHGGLR